MKHLRGLYVQTFFTFRTQTFFTFRTTYVHHKLHFLVVLDFINLIKVRNKKRVKILQRPSYSQKTPVDVTIKSRCITFTSHLLTTRHIEVCYAT
jgi:hypothetical protein